MLVLLAGLVATTTGAAETPLLCDGASVSRLSIVTTPSGSRLRFRGLYKTATGLDPAANGLTIDMTYAPETAPASDLLSATIPGGSFTPTGNGVSYRDPAGTINGITKIKIVNKGADKKILLQRQGSALGAHEGVVRVVLSSGTSCARTCGTTCTGPANRQSCRASKDTSLCGVRSGCEVLNVAGGNCMLPYPSSYFEATDVGTTTGRRINYQGRTLPVNKNDVHINPAKWNDLDGFSPGTMALVKFPQGVDLVASNVPSQTNFAGSLAANSPTILLDADTGQRVEHFAENDVSIGANSLSLAPPNQVFIIRPGRRLKNNGRYIVALRNLVGQDALPIQPEAAFQALRDGTPSGNAELESRRPVFEDIFTKLTAAGIPRNNLLLAWDFHTASDDSIQGWLLHMRDETFAQLGPNNAPNFTVDTVEDDPLISNGNTQPDPRVCRRIRGTYEVPLYTTFDGEGSVLNLVGGVPTQNGVVNAPFTAIIPCSLANAPSPPGRPIFYGHGLLGSGFGEVTSGHLRELSNNYRYVVVATDWQGMSADDVFIIITTLIQDLTNFPMLSERLHQGVLNQLVLGRLLGAPNGLISHPAFSYDVGSGPEPTYDPSEVFYYGNSQGGILGGTVMALTQETTRGVLGVPAANFSTLLQRSVDFNPYFALLRTNYPDDINRALTYPLLQQLWDKSEPNGWYHRTLANPLPGTPAHKLLIHMATSDAEVANIATEIMVRTMGIPQVSPVVSSYFDIPEMAASFDGSAMVESDGSYGPVPQANLPPANNGAHGAMRNRPAIQAQIDAFLKTNGDVQNFCVGPCNPE
jgi:hypothetical protein